MDHNPRSDLRRLLRAGLSKSLVSLFIKVATAGLTYVMYVVLSRDMGDVEYGYFAFGLSLATMLSIGASFGQPTAILRYWPEQMVAGRPDKAVEAVRSGGALTLLGGVGVSVALVAGAALSGAYGAGPVLHLYAAAALILPMAFAEYWSSVLRAQGSVWTGLSPRDLMWRFAVPVAVAAFWLSGIQLPGWAALLLTAGLLAISLGVQFLLARFRHYEIAVSAEHLGGFWRERGKASRWFLIGTVLDSAALNMDIIFVGLLVAPSVAGVYFNAFRTAGLLTLFMFAITIVVAPMVAHHFHAGEMRKAQAITALCAWAGFLFSLVVFVGFLVFGDQVMSLFGGSHEQGALLLVILSVGLLFDAATGPSRIMLMMTGHERAYVRIFGAVIVLAMIVQIPVILAYGAIGAAVVNTLGRIAAQIGIAWYAHKKIGLDTTLLGAFLVNRHADRLA